MSDPERLPARDYDSGEVERLPDGSVSIPVFEERLVVHKRKVVRERIVVRKRVVTEEARVGEELRRQRIEIEADRAVVDLIEDEPTEAAYEAAAGDELAVDADPGDEDDLLGERDLDVRPPA